MASFSADNSGVQNRRSRLPAGLGFRVSRIYGLGLRRGSRAYKIFEFTVKGLSSWDAKGTTAFRRLWASGEWVSG